MAKRVLGGAFLAVVLLALVIVGRTVRYESRQPEVEPVSADVVDATAAGHRLAEAVTFRTISHQDTTRMDGAEFRRFHAYLEAAFPRVHAALRRETVGGYSLLYEWPGAGPDLAPIVLMAHMDAVPIEAGTEGDWSHPPFGGEVADGFVWGRGTMDDKGSLVAILEAVETLLLEGVEPQRGLFLAFGHDEEVGGRNGAMRIAELLRTRGIQAAFVLDEGGTVADGLIPGVDRPVALVGIAEKGYLSLELTARTQGGHSSMPPPQTAVGMVAAAVEALEENQMPAAIRGATAAMFDYLGPEMPILPRMLFANRWLFSPLITRRFGATDQGGAILRTTTAPTILEGGVKDNVLPSSARAVVNFRIMPGDSSGSVIEHVRRTIDNPLITVEPLGSVSEPSPISDIASDEFRLIQGTIREVYGDVLVVPWLVVGGTDARHFTGVSTQVYRFSGGRVGADDMSRVHGTDERVGLETHAETVTFYLQLLRNAAM